MIRGEQSWDKLALVGRVLLASMIAAVVGATPSPTGSKLIEGQVVKVDLSRSQLIVKVAGPRELVVVVDGSRTWMSRQGRALRLDDIRPGEKLTASCEDAVKGPCQARVVKIGAWKRPGPDAGKGSE